MIAVNFSHKIANQQMCLRNILSQASVKRILSQEATPLKFYKFFYFHDELFTILIECFFILAIHGLTKTNGGNSETNSRPASPPSNGTPTHIPKGNNR